MTLTEKVAYLKGLAEGLDLDKDTKEVKKCKSSAIFFNIHMFVDVKVYELLENGYELIL